VLAELRRSNAEIDQHDIHSTLETLPSADTFLDRATQTSIVVVERPDTRALVGYGWTQRWTEDDRTQGHLVVPYLAPGVHGPGHGHQLLRELEMRAQASDGAASDHGHSLAHQVVAANASSVQPELVALLRARHFLQTFDLVELQLARRPASRLALPAGIRSRTVQPGDAPAIADLTRRVWSGRTYSTATTTARVAAWLARSDLDLFDVALSGERIVGLVASNITPARAEVEDVQVDPDLQRRGLATAMLGAHIAKLARRTPAVIRLHTEGHDPAGALSLYRGLGFEIVRTHHNYRRPLDAAIP